MSFPPDVKENVLIRAARRCCVCRRFKGIGVEVHHIVPEAEGGPSNLDNAILLCFDCHCAAGHYNAKHPRGTKYRPSELRRHRDDWYRSVEEAGTQPLGADEFSGYYTRHLICLDNEAARDLIESNKSQIPFRYDYLMESDVLRFMVQVLDDELPFAWADSRDLTGHYWASGDYKSLEDFYDQHPEFGRELSRPLTAEDIVEGGLVPSRFIRRLVDCGFPPHDLGNACVQEHGCGEGPTYFVAMRRPLFVFAELRNTSPEQIRLSGLIVRNDQNESVYRKFDSWSEGELTSIPYDNLVLEPGEVLLIPECLLLSSINHDPIGNEFEDTQEMSREQVQAIGYRSSTTADDFFWFGPSIKLEGFDLEVGSETRSVPIHRFDPSKCYVYYRAWMVGSCPHLYVSNNPSSWRYLGEILSDPTRKTLRMDRISIPENVSRIRIVETDFEVSLIEYVDFCGERLIESPIRLERGDSIELEVRGPGVLTVVGRYHARIMAPRSYLHLRQKLSLRSAYEHAALS